VESALKQNAEAPPPWAIGRFLRLAGTFWNWQTQVPELQVDDNTLEGVSRFFLVGATVGGAEPLTLPAAAAHLPAQSAWLLQVPTSRPLEADGDGDG